MTCGIVSAIREGDGYEHHPIGKAFRAYESTGTAGSSYALRAAGRC